MPLFIFLILFGSLSVSLAVQTEEPTALENNQIEIKITKSEYITQLMVRKEGVNKDLIENNIWSKIYSNYHTYKEIKKNEAFLSAIIRELTNKSYLSAEEKVSLKEYRQKKVTFLAQLEPLQEYASDPFKKFLTPPKIEAIPQVGNLFAVIGAWSYQEKLNSDKEEYDARYQSLSSIMKKLKEKHDILEELMVYDTNNKEYKVGSADIEEQIQTFTPVIDIFRTTNNVYTKKIDEIKLSLKSDIKRELERAMTIAAVILFFILFLFLIKYFVRKYMSDNERIYTINKALNIFFITLSLLTILLAYIENISYLVTILGFASAGIAIALKDWFMSIMGWFTIILGGAIHVGDRVKFVRDGVEYVGDIVDISMLRMTMHEDVTLTTYMVNRRAGRIVFIPNNFIFTDMIANYAHAGLKTVWDGIDFVVTFDSNIQKTTQIAKEVSKKYSKGYTDMTRKQLNKLRSQYSMKNTNVEPRIFAHIETYGMKVSAWYLTNSYATMTLRSTISVEIITRIQAEDDIHLAFPTQSVYLDKDVRKTLPIEEPINVKS